MMTGVPPAAPVARTPIATGWLLWLTWLFVIVAASGILFSVLVLIVGADRLTQLIGLTVNMPALTAWWMIEQAAYVLFGIACVGVLAKDRDLAGISVVLAWVIVVFQCIDALLQLFEARISIPAGAVLYLAYALKMSSVLRGPKQDSPSIGRGAI